MNVIGKVDHKIGFSVHILLISMIFLPLSTGMVNCRVACKRCELDKDHPSKLEIYCAMCEECKLRRLEKMGRTISQKEGGSTNEYAKPIEDKDTSHETTEPTSGTTVVTNACETVPPCSSSEETTTTSKPTTKSTTKKQKTSTTSQTTTTSASTTKKQLKVTHHPRKPCKKMPHAIPFPAMPMHHIQVQHAMPLPAMQMQHALPLPAMPMQHMQMPMMQMPMLPMPMCPQGPCPDFNYLSFDGRRQDMTTLRPPTTTTLKTSSLATTVQTTTVSSQKPGLDFEYFYIGVPKNRLTR